ncbi:XRE family transcriptional regulator [Nocardia cyriacigeorgica]|uniref:XRE family transcriptional regulator n=1 Tax=Nocardia cyriacigeorgica TaxID=135487 RepID=UPI001895BE1E|nr:XRE family transcriptional regulator [Nocardia cyriacigeorgica]MBF6085205.1 XRE family transcriptional regulator [Nocardia cyriacigeorgica]
MSATAPIHDDEIALKDQLMGAIETAARERGLNKTQAAAFLGVKQPEFSYLVNRHFNRLSLSKLLAWAGKFDINYRLTFEVLPSQ